MLRDHRRHHAGKNVARTAGGHSGIPCRIHPGFAIGLHDQRPVSFKHDNQVMFAREMPRNIQPVFLHIGC